MTTHHEPVDGLSGLDALMRVGGEDDPAGGRPRRRWGLVIAAIVLVVVLGVPGAYVAWATTAATPAPSAISHTPQVAPPAAATLALPSEGAAAISVSGGDEYLGAAASGIWATSGGNEARPLASISKLITALVVLDARPLASADDPGPTITFDEADDDLYDEYYVRGATIARMPLGSTMSQRDALATMLIPSASNYAEAVATWAFGSQSGFVGATRRWLAAQGLTGTTIVEPTGIDPRNTSTPGDLIAIGKLAAANPAVSAIAGTRSLSLPGPGMMQNTNELLGSNGITGLKTGNLGLNSHNLLYTASLDVGTGSPLSVTGVALGGHSDDTVNLGVIALLDSIRDGFRPVPVATSGQVVGAFSTPWGSEAQMVISESASIFTWSDTPIAATMETTTPTTYADGEVIGSITWTAGPQTVTADIEIEGTIEPPTVWWRLTHPGELVG